MQLIHNIFQNAPIKTIIRNIDGTQKKLYKMNGPGIILFYYIYIFLNLFNLLAVTAFVALAREYVNRINATVSFKPKRKDTLTRLDIPIYEVLFFCFLLLFIYIFSREQWLI